MIEYCAPIGLFQSVVQWEDRILSHDWRRGFENAPLTLIITLFRYVDIVLGLSFLLTHALLMHSSKHESRSHLTLYFVLSISTLLLYWIWFAYLKYAMAESEASKEVNNNSLRVSSLNIHDHDIMLNDEKQFSDMFI